MASQGNTASFGQPLNIKLGIVGGGNMAKSLILPLIEQGVLDPENVIVSARSDSTLIPWREAGCATTTENARVTATSEVVLWGIKPQFFKEAVPQDWNWFENYKYVYESTLHISILAGITIETIMNTLKSKRKENAGGCLELKTVRTMPNMASEVGCGIVVYAPGPGVNEEDENVIKRLFSPTSNTFKVREEQINAYTSIMGSGIGFMCPILEAMSDAAVSLGIPRDVSLQLAAQVMKGTGELMLKTKRHPGVIKDSICSPGGTTIAGVIAMEESGVRKGIINAIKAANTQGEKLARLK